MAKKKKNTKKKKFKKRIGMYQTGSYAYDDVFPTRPEEENRPGLRTQFNALRPRLGQAVEPAAVGLNLLAASNLSSDRPSLFNAALTQGLSGALTGGLPGAVLGGLGGLFSAGNRRTALAEQEAAEERRFLLESRVSPSTFKKGGKAGKGRKKRGKNDAVNLTGYKKGSPTEDRPFNIIPGSKITMKGVDKNVLAIPSRGNPVLMKPGDKDRDFKGSDFVLEIAENIPKKQFGGRNTPTGTVFPALAPSVRSAPSFNISSDSILQQIGSGGINSAFPLMELQQQDQNKEIIAQLTAQIQELQVTGGNEKEIARLKRKVSRLLSQPSLNQIDQNVRQKTQIFREGGFVPEVAIQTEEGETIAMPNLHIPDVLATEKHEKMDEDEVTDIVPQGSYVFSHLKSRRIDPKKWKDEDDLLGVGVGYNDEFDSHESEVLLLSDIIKKKATFADASRQVRKWAPVVEDDCDILTMATNEENLDSRKKPIEKLIDMQEEKNGNKVKVFKQGGEVEKYQFGGTLGRDSQLALMSGLEADQELLNTIYAQSLQDANSLFNRQNRRAGLGLAANTAFSLFQDTSVEPFIERPLFLDERFRGTNNATINKQAGQLRSQPLALGRDLIASGIDPARVPSLLAQQTGQSVNAVSNLFNQNNLRNQSLRSQRFGEQARIANGNEQRAVLARNQGQANTNAQIAAIGSGVDSYIDARSTLDRQNFLDVDRLTNANVNGNIRLNDTIQSIRARLAQNDVITPTVANVAPLPIVNSSLPLTPPPFGNQSGTGGLGVNSPLQAAPSVDPSLSTVSLGENMSALPGYSSNSASIRPPSGSGGLFDLVNGNRTFTQPLADISTQSNILSSTPDIRSQKQNEVASLLRLRDFGNNLTDEDLAIITRRLSELQQEGIEFPDINSIQLIDRGTLPIPTGNLLPITNNIR